MDIVRRNGADQGTDCVGQHVGTDKYILPRSENRRVEIFNIRRQSQSGDGNKYKVSQIAAQAADQLQRLLPWRQVDNGRIQTAGVRAQGDPEIRAPIIIPTRDRGIDDKVPYVRGRKVCRTIPAGQKLQSFRTPIRAIAIRHTRIDLIKVAVWIRIPGVIVPIATVVVGYRDVIDTRITLRNVQWQQRVGWYLPRRVGITVWIIWNQVGAASCNSTGIEMIVNKIYAKLTKISVRPHGVGRDRVLNERAAIVVVVLRRDDKTVGIERVKPDAGGGLQAGAIVDRYGNRIKTVGRQTRQRHVPARVVSRKLEVTRYINAIFHDLDGIGRNGGSGTRRHVEREIGVGNIKQLPAVRH